MWRTTMPQHSRYANNRLGTEGQNIILPWVSREEDSGEVCTWYEEIGQSLLPIASRGAGGGGPVPIHASNYMAVSEKCF